MPGKLIVGEDEIDLHQPVQRAYSLNAVNIGRTRMQMPERHHNKN